MSGRSSAVEYDLAKVEARVRFPSPALENNNSIKYEGSEPEGVVGGVVPLRFRGDSEDVNPSVQRGRAPMKRSGATLGTIPVARSNL